MSLNFKSGFFVILCLAHLAGGISLKKGGRNGLIVFDNVLWHGDVAKKNVIDSQTEIIRKFNVKALHQHIEWTPETILKSLSLKMENGCDMCVECVYSKCDK